MGADLRLAAEALQGYRPVGQRMLPSRLGPWLLLQDCYNANPRSTETALETLATLPGPRAAILGSMLELGPTEADLHQRVGRKAGQLGIDLLIAVGPMAGHYAAGCSQSATRAVQCASHAQAALALQSEMARGGTVLVKGSRGARMEQVVASLASSFSAEPAASNAGGRH